MRFRLRKTVKNCIPYSFSILLGHVGKFQAADPSQEDSFKMAGNTKKTSVDHSYPVWVGNIHESVSEDMLRQRFSGFGAIKSCSILLDDTTGHSKHLGYINFVKRSEAERAAKKLNGYKLNGRSLRTKGPGALGREGHLKRPVDFRPLTDCSFFLKKNDCKNGNKVSCHTYNCATPTIVDSQ